MRIITAIKNRISVKMILVTGGILALVVGGITIAYFLYFSTPESGEKRVYSEQEMAHLTLPEEMLRFSFTHFPDLYASMREYDLQMTLITDEIARIEAIGTQYPEQQKIVDTEKKIWEKTRDRLQKTFLKIEKPVTETYVLFRINPAAGSEKIRSLAPELNQEAQSALSEAQELTQPLKAARDDVPKGMVKKMVDTLKKMIP